MSKAGRKKSKLKYPSKIDYDLNLKLIFKNNVPLAYFKLQRPSQLNEKKESTTWHNRLLNLHGNNLSTKTQKFWISKFEKFSQSSRTFKVVFHSTKKNNYIFTCKSIKTKNGYNICGLFAGKIDKYIPTNKNKISQSDLISSDREIEMLDEFRIEGYLLKQLSKIKRHYNARKIGILTYNNSTKEMLYWFSVTNQQNKLELIKLNCQKGPLRNQLVQGHIFTIETKNAATLFTKEVVQFFNKFEAPYFQLYPLKYFTSFSGAILIVPEFKKDLNYNLLNDHIFESFIHQIAGVIEFRNQKQELRGLKIYISQLERMAQLTEFAAGIGHEINNPLSVILNSAEFILKTLNKTPSFSETELKFIKKMLEKICKRSHNIKNIVKGLMAFVQEKENLPLENIQVNKVIQNALEFCQEKISKHCIDLRVHPLPNNLHIQCRPIQITQVILNLLNNAHDAILNNKDKWIDIDFVEKGNNLEILVTDSGHGIPHEIFEKILMPFFTTKPKDKGTGIGLSICKGIVEGHHGYFNIDKDCKNTRFIVGLPIALKGLDS